MEYIGIQKKNGGVVEALQQAILSGQIPAGTEMTQNELAESLGVSRMPVREALMILEYQGLIIRLPNNRIKAADLTEETLRQILALGAQLERQAMRALPQDAMLAGDEMLQHRTLRTVLPYPLHRKLLESIQETYIAFAVSARPAPVNDRLSRLLMLDRQLQITEGTVEILKKNLETVQAMKDAGIYGTTSAAVEQSRTAYAQVMASLPDIRQSIRETENALCLMLHQPAQSIARGVLEEQQLPTEFSVGIPLQLLSNRPDVKAAEMSLAANYYNTNSARAAFYPQITLSGSGGWTNNSGAGIVNPGKLLASAIGSLTQPLFYRGANIARLKQAKAQEEQAKIQFQTALLNAGNEVSNALHLYQMEKDKAVSRTIQVNSARQAASDTKELFNLGTSTYLEVLSAEQSYLSAQLAEVSDTFSSMQAVISLYQALGGGRE